MTQGRDQPGYSLLPGLYSPPAWSSLPLPCVSSAGSSAAPRRCDIVPGPEERPRGPVKPHVSGELASTPDTLLHTSALGLTLGRTHPPHRHQECPAPSRPGFLPDYSRPQASSSGNSPVKGPWVQLHENYPTQCFCLLEDFQAQDSEADLSPVPKELPGPSVLNPSLSVWRTLWVGSPSSFWKMSVVDAEKPEWLLWPGGVERAARGTAEGD